MNSLEDLDPSCLGEAGLVYEHILVSISAHSHYDKIHLFYFIFKK